jgi:hypothetical protein
LYWGAAWGIGGRCLPPQAVGHDLPGRPCRHTKVILFTIFFEIGFFLANYWGMWSFLLKILYIHTYIKNELGLEYF